MSVKSNLWLIRTAHLLFVWQQPERARLICKAIDKWQQNSLTDVHSLELCVRVIPSKNEILEALTCY